MTAKKDDKPKRKVPDPIPVIGVRGSGTKISLAKTAAVVTGASLTVVGAGAQLSALDQLGVEGRPLGESLDQASESVMLRAREIWDAHKGKILLGGGLALIFGKKFDRSHPDFPIRLGK